MIEVEHLSKTYGSTAAIADVSFSVESGEILGFLGPNGAGKTTTMRILSGYLPASSGTARIAGLDIHEQSMAVRQRIGYLPENPPLYPEMTVEGFLFFVSRIKLVPAGDRARRVTSAIERCGLTEKRKVLIRKLSKGFRQRVGIAQAIVHDPPVIILDEPTVGLDPRQIIEVRNLIKSLAGQHTIILSTHILPEVSMTCSRVTIINRGKVVAAGSPERLTGELAADAGYELEIEGEGDDRVNNLLLPSLENLPGVRSIELIGEQLSIGRYRLRAVTESDAEPGREIAAAIVGSGFGLCEMRRTRASLEDVFLRLTEAEKKSDADLVHSEPEVDRNLQAESQKQESIADSQPSPSRSIAENLPVLERQELPYDPQPESEPLAETIESIELPQTEPISEISESGTISQAESAVSEISESIEQSPASSEAADFPESSQVEPVSEINESIEPPETISATADVREISQVEPVSETGESIEPSEAISETVDVRELPESEPVSEISESIELPESEPIAETSESIELPESEPIAETIESIELTQSTSELIVEDLEVKETLESSGEIQSEMQPVADFLQAVEIPDAIANYQSEAISEIIEPLEISQPEPDFRNN
ncbi:MAG: ATP-binding cassette domain-containing protein [Microcoleus sp. SU_5_6]|nr:ATP-binding cassette domain-containing protein [Microcoleus sp. SU_5_6]